FQAEDGIRDRNVTGVQTCALPILPVNHLVRVPGTPLADAPNLDPLEFVRTIAVARITMPRAMVRLSAGRESMDDSTQALCFMAGAHSLFMGGEVVEKPQPSLDAGPGPPEKA